MPPPTDPADDAPLPDQGAPAPPTVPEPGGPPLPEDGGDEVAKQIAGQRRAMLRASILAGTQQNPDEAVATQRIAAQTGLPPEVVDRNKPAAAAQARAQAINMGDLLQHYPATNSWLSKPGNAAVAHDDVPALQQLERTFNYLNGETDVTGYLPHGYQWAPDGSIQQPLPGGLANVYRGLDDLADHLRMQGNQALADEVSQQAAVAHLASILPPGTRDAAVVGGGFLQGMQAGLGTGNPFQQEDAFRSLAQVNPDLANSFWGGKISRFAGGLAGSAPALIAGTGLGGVGGLADVVATLKVLNRARTLVSPIVGDRIANFAATQAKAVAGMTPLNVQQAAQDFDQHGDVTHAAVNLLISQAVVGAIPMSAFEQKLFAGQPANLVERASAQEGYQGAARGFLASIGLQATQGAVQSLGNSLNDRATLGIPLDPKKAFEEAATNGALGGLLGGAFGMGANVAHKMHQDAVAAHAGMEFADNLRMAVETLKTSKLNQRSPEAMADAMAAMQKDGVQHVYLPADAWREHWQGQGQDPHAMAEQANAGASYREAQATGGEMQVPVADFMQAAATSKASDGLVNAARAAPGAPSGVEGHAMLSQAPEQIAAHYEALGKAVGEMQENGSPAADAIHEDLLHQLFMAYPGASTEHLDTYAQSASNMFAVLAHRLGVDPLAFFKQFPLTVTGDAGLIASHERVQAVMRDALSRLDRGEKGNPEEAMGKALEGVRSAVEGMGMQFKEHALDTIQENLTQSMTQRYEQRGIPVPASGELDKRSLRAEWRKAHGGRAPSAFDKSWQQLVENSRQVDMATNNPAMKALADYERGQREMHNGHRIVIADVPYGAGKSRDGKTIYISRQIPRFLTIDGKEVDVHQLIADHEDEEQGLMKHQESYQRAHQTAEKVEDHEADKQVPHAAYEAALKPYIEAARKHADKAKIPTDLDEKPYHDMGEAHLIEGRSGRPAGLQTLHQPARGSLEFGDGKFRMTIGKNADVSTWFHELMHMWTEVMGELSQRADTPQQIKDDYQAMLTFSGYGTHDNKLRMQAEALAIANGARGRDLTPEESAKIAELNAPHEKLAEAHEAYMMRGEAPAEDVRGVFAKIAAWMRSVYQQMKALGVELNPEITAVFDRLHATDEAIEAASKEAGTDPIFKDAAASGWGAEKFAAYAKRAADLKASATAKASQDAIKEFRRTQSADYKAKRDAIHDEVEQEVNNRQVYAAIHALQAGEGPNGEPLPEIAPDGHPFGEVKLNRGELVALYGKDILKELPGPGQRNSGRHIYTSDGGMSLERAADIFGYDSADAMVRDLKDAPSKKEVIEANTNAKMAKLYPDALRDGTLIDKALDALHSQGKAQQEHDEAQALAERVKKEAVPLAMIRATAQKQIISRRVVDLRPEQYRSAEAKAARDVEAALAKGDFEKAFAAKTRKILSAELYKAAVEAQRATDKAVDYIRGTDTQAARMRIGKAGGWEWTVSMPDGTTRTAASQKEALDISRSYGNAPVARTSSYLQQMDALKERYDFHRVSASQLERRESLRQWVAKKTAAGEPVAIPEHLLDQIGSRNWREASVGELFDLRDAIKNIEKMARLKNKLLAKNRKDSFDEAVDRQVKSIEEVGPRVRKEVNSKHALSTITDGIEVKGNAMFQVPAIVRRLDGHETGGAVFEEWQVPIDHAANHNQEMDAEDIKQVHDALKRWGKLSGGDPRSWWNNVALNNREHIPEINEALSKWTQIMVAYNWGNEGNRERLMQGHNWKAEQVMAIINRLDAKDKALVHDMWKITSTRRTEIGALEERVHGIAPEWVEASPFQNHLGTWDGGYAPIVYDNSRSRNPHGVSTDEGADLLAGRGGAYAMTSHGHAKERQGSQGRPLKLNWEVFPNHLQKVNKDLAWRETLMDANRFLNDERWSQAVIKTVGKSGWDQFYNQIHAIAGTDKAIATGLESIVGWANAGANASMRAFNVGGSLTQLLGLPGIIPRVGLNNFVKALRDAFNPASHHWMEKVDTFMKYRNAERGKMLNEAIKNTSIIGPLKWLPDTAYLFMNKAWSVLDAHAWYAAYYKAMDQHGGDMAKAIDIARSEMSQTQGPTHTKDMAQMMRGGPLAKLLTNNMGWASSQFNLMVGSVQRYVDKGGTWNPTSNPVEAAKMASDMLVYLVVCPAIYLAGRQAIGGQSMQDWADPKATAGHLRDEALYTVLSSMPIFRDAAHALTKGQRMDSLQGMSGISQMVNAGAAVVHALKDEKEHREKPGLNPAVKALIEGASIPLHFPGRQVIRMIDGFNKAETDGTNRVRGLLMGPPPKD